MANPGPTASTPARAEVVQKLLDAATALFGARGPDAVSLREVAAEAGVNYGLIHQYVGSKDDLLRLVCRSVSEQTAAGFAEAADLDAVLDRLSGAAPGPSPYTTMLTWALLQGHDAAELLGRSPALSALAERLGHGDEPDHEVSVRIVGAMSLVLGWKLYGPFLRRGVGLGARRRTGPGGRAAAAGGRAARARAGPRRGRLTTGPPGRARRRTGDGRAAPETRAAAVGRARPTPAGLSSDTPRVSSPGRPGYPQGYADGGNPTHDDQRGPARLDALPRRRRSTTWPTSTGPTSPGSPAWAASPGAAAGRSCSPGCWWPSWPPRWPSPSAARSPAPGWDAQGSVSAQVRDELRRDFPQVGRRVGGGRLPPAHAHRPGPLRACSSSWRSSRAPRARPRCSTRSPCRPRRGSSPAAARRR